MKFYVRELPQKQYHYQSHDILIIPCKCRGIKPGDKWCTTWNDYHIEKVEYAKDTITVYATKTKLQKPRSNSFYKKKRE